MIRDMQLDEFDQVFSIMERSFPTDEYRTYEEQKQLLREPPYRIYVADHPSNHKQIAAFLAVWQFDEFVFVEHFAADPSVRGQGLGSDMLREAVRIFSKQICLEVELPETELAKRRIAFYERNGFCYNAYPYMQPSISKGKQPLPLRIMTLGEIISKDRFEAIQRQLYKSVYKRRTDTNEAAGLDEAAIVLQNAKETDVRNFLLQALRKDPRLFAQFKRYTGCGITESEMAAYRQRIDAVVQKYAGKDRMISYRETAGFLAEMGQFLTEEVRLLMEQGYDAAAFQLVCALFTEIGMTDMDDSDGLTGIFAAQCTQIWETLAGRGDSQLKRQMYEWFTSQLDQEAEDYLSECMEQVLMESFTDREYLEEKLAFTKRKAKEVQADSDSWSVRYHAQKWALRHLTLLEEAGADALQIEQYCKDYWKYADVRKYYIERCIRNRDYDEAVCALRESLVMDAGMPGLVRQFGKRLKEVYHMSGQTDAYIRQLWQLVTKEHAGNPQDFQELKTIYSKEEWPKVREKIFQALPQQAHVERFYYEEGMYDRLLEYVLSAKGLYAVQQYQDVLQKDYPDQLLGKYTKELKEMVQRSADRRHYQEWSAILRRMMQIEGGQKEVQQLVSDWRVRYKNRPAMMEELKQF